MTSAAADDAASQAEPLRQRVAAHAANRFVLAMVRVVTPGLDLTDAVLLLAILQANLAPITAYRDLQPRFAALGAFSDDEPRRPISVTALAASLRLPFETVRRRLARLARRGMCEATERGYRLPDRVMAEPRFAGGHEVIYSELVTLHVRLTAVGCLPPSGAVAESIHREPPVRIASRLATDYLLRALAMLSERTGDPVNGVLVAAIFNGNATAFEATAGSAPIGAADGLLPDADLRPVPAAEAARQLSLPHETVRRRLRGLEERGLCARARGGWIIPQASLRPLRFEAALEENMGHLRQMFSNLARLGVLAGPAPAGD